MLNGSIKSRSPLPSSALAALVARACPRAALPPLAGWLARAVWEQVSLTVTGASTLCTLLSSMRISMALAHRVFTSLSYTRSERATSETAPAPPPQPRTHRRVSSGSSAGVRPVPLHALLRSLRPPHLDGLASSKLLDLSIQIARRHLAGEHWQRGDEERRREERTNEGAKQWPADARAGQQHTTRHARSVGQSRWDSPPSSSSVASARSHCFSNETSLKPAKT